MPLYPYSCNSCGADGRGLGWFCLFVAITAVPVSVQTLLAAGSTWDIWFGLCWAAWAVLWLVFFILLVMQKPIGRFVGNVTVPEGILTGWLPGYLLLVGAMH
jgi:putative amide transporter protein